MLVTSLVVSIVLLVVGVVLFLRGRAALEEATRVKSGFGGPPGSLDIGTELGFGVEEHRQELLSAQRTRLWGLVLGAVGLVALVVTLVLLAR